MPSDYRIRPITPEDQGALLALHATVFPARSAAEWNWRFLEQPTHQRHLFLAESEPGAVVASLGGIVLDFQLNGEPCLGVLLGDAAIHPSMRDGLLGGRILDRLFRRIFDPVLEQSRVFWGFPEPSVIELTTRRTRARVLRDLVFLARDREPSSTSPTILPVEQVAELDASTDDLWSRCSRELNTTTCRNRALLNWRFARRPSVNYQIFVARDPDSRATRGVAVTRSGGYQPDTLSLMEWLVPAADEEAESALMSTVMGHLDESGHAALVTWIAGSHHWFQRFQRNHGFHVIRTPYQQIFRTCTEPPRITRRWMDENWYCTMADIDFYLRDMAYIYHIELTHLCNLRCTYCSLTESLRPRGMMSEEVFRKVLDHMVRQSPLNYMMLHNFGESLLHPELTRFVALGAEHGLNPGFTSNGETLTPELLQQLIDAGLRWMCVTFHTEGGRQAFERCKPVAQRAELLFWGRELVPAGTPPEPTAPRTYGIEKQWLHTFGGTVGPAEEQPPGWRPRCDYLDRGFVNVLHDGRVVPCTVDEEAAEVLGTVDDLESIQQEPSYEMCRKCEGFAFFDGVRSGMRKLHEEDSLRMDFRHWQSHLPEDDQVLDHLEGGQASPMG